MTQRIYDAINMVAILHNGQYRKDKKTPFITHPFFVGMVLSHYTDDEDIVIAGLFHDVLEDVPGQTRDHIARDFGDRVADIEGVRKEGEQFWSYFSAPKQEYKWFYESALSIAQERLENPIVEELSRVVQRANKEIFASGD